MPRLHNWMFLVIVVCCVAATVDAQQTNPEPTAAVRAGRMIDVRTGKVSTNVYILIAKDRILRIADSAPAGLSVTDLSKYTVVDEVLAVLLNCTWRYARIRSRLGSILPVSG